MTHSTILCSSAVFFLTATLLFTTTQSVSYRERVNVLPFFWIVVHRLALLNSALVYVLAMRKREATALQRVYTDAPRDGRSFDVLQEVSA